MLLPSKPMSNAERQRQFQEAHPGYDRRRKARQRARHSSLSAQARAAAEAIAAEPLGESIAMLPTLAPPLVWAPAVEPAPVQPTSADAPERVDSPGVAG